MSQRRRSREVALQILFEDDVNTRGSVAELEQFLSGRLNNPEAETFARDLILGVRRNQEGIDEKIGQIADNWSVKRMAGADRNVLRLATYEVLHTDTPFAVAVNEAGAFVNGILDKLRAHGEGGGE